MLKHNKKKEVYDRMRARRARIMKRLSGRTPENDLTSFGSHYSGLSDSCGSASGGKSGRIFDLTMILYLLLFFTPFIIVILGVLEYKSRY